MYKHAQGVQKGLTAKKKKSSYGMSTVPAVLVVVQDGEEDLDHVVAGLHTRHPRGDFPYLITYNFLLFLYDKEKNM